jgi:hypothetical protein
MAAPILKLNGTAITNTVEWTSLDLTSVLTKEVSTLQFVIKKGIGQTFPAITLPVMNDQIDLYDTAGTHIFGGVVTQIETTIEGLLASYQVTATDWGFKLDHYLVKKSYVNMDAYDIVADIISNFANSGFTLTHVNHTGYNISSIRFNYMPVTKALEKLAKLIGWEWFVDPDKDIHFFLGAVANGVGDGGAAPFNIDATSGNVWWKTIDILQSIQNLKNSVFIIGGNQKKIYTAANTPDAYVTNGTQTVFSLAYHYDSSTIVVTLNGTSQTIGTDGQTADSQVQVQYNSNGRFIRFTSVPTTGQTVKIYGTANVPLIGHSTNPTSIVQYGEIQDAIPDAQITSWLEAQERAQADLLQFGHPTYDVKFTTITPGLQIGQTIMLNLPTLGINNYSLVVRRMEVTGHGPMALQYAVEAIGSDIVTFVDIMSNLLRQETDNTDTDNAVIPNLVSVPESLAVADTVAVSHTSGPYVWDNAISRYGFVTWG